MSTPPRARSPQRCNGFTVVVTKSTVPVGTGDEVERIIREANPTADFVVASNPEFLREGAAIRDFKLPDRIVVGTRTNAAARCSSDVYRPLYSQRGADHVHRAAHGGADQIRRQCVSRHQDHLHQRDRRSCEKVGADVQDVARGIGLDNRIGSEVPACRPRLWRLVLSEGHARAGQDRAGLRRASCASSKPCSASTTTASARWRARSRTRSAAACAARRSPCSASPSSPTPTTCARRRRSRW